MEKGTNGCQYLSRRYGGVCYSEGSEHQKEDCPNGRVRRWGRRDVGL